MSKTFRNFFVLSAFILSLLAYVACSATVSDDSASDDNKTTPTTITPNDSGPTTTPTIPLTFTSLDEMFNLDYLSEIVIDVSLDQWNTLLTNYATYDRNEEIVRANFSYNDGNGKGVSIDNVSIRTRGNSSRRTPEDPIGGPHNAVNPQWRAAHFKIAFDKFSDIYPENKDRKFLDKYDGLILKWFKDDPMFVREIYSYNLFTKFGVWTAARVKYTKVYIHVEGDAKPAYFGMYVMLEDFGKNMITQRQKKNIDPNNSLGIGYTKNDGNLWKCTWQGNDPADLSSNNIDSKMGVEAVTLYPATSKTYSYDLKTNKKTDESINAAKAELKTFIQNLENKTGSDFKTWIDASVDVDLLLKTYAVNVTLGMWDDFWVNSNNYYIYFDNTDGKTYFIPYDYDNTLGTSAIVSDSGTQNPLYWGDRSTSQKQLITKILNIPEYETKYKNYLKELIDPSKDLFYVDKSIARINKWQSLIANHLNSDIVNCNQFESPITCVETFKAFEDKPAWWGNQSKYRLLTGDDTTNFFRAKTNAINQYCN